MLKISKLSDDAVPIVLRLEGKIVGPWVDELRRVCTEATRGEGQTARLVLDLSGVSFLDSDAVALLRELVTGHVSVTNYSVFVAEQLKEVSDGSR